MKKLLVVLVLCTTISPHCLVASSCDSNDYCTPGLLQIMVKYGHNPDGIPALHYAIKMKDEGAVRLLLEHGADANAVVDRTHEHIKSALDYAAAYGSATLVRLLVSYGANLTNKPLDYRTDGPRDLPSPLHVAAEVDNAETIQALIECGADRHLEYSGDTPLHVAAQHHSLNAVKILLQMGCYVNSLSNYGHTPLCYAVDCWPHLNIKNPELVIRTLLEAGANPNLAVLYAKKPIFRVNNVRSLAILMEYGADVNARDERGETVLHYAVQCWEHSHGRKDDWYLTAIELLINAGADVNAQDDTGRRPLDRTYKEDVRNLLLRYGAK